MNRTESDGSAARPGTAAAARTRPAGEPRRGGTVSADRSIPMRNGLLGAIAALAAGAGLAYGQGAPWSPAAGPRMASAMTGAPGLLPAAGAEVVPVGGMAPSPVVPYPGDPGFTPYGPDGGAPAGGAAPAKSERAYYTAEYLLYGFKTGPVNFPLVTTGTAGGLTSPLGSKGVLGQVGTAIVFGGRAFDFDGASGARVTLGFWIDADRTTALEFSGFVLSQVADVFTMQSSVEGDPVIARPFIAADTNQQTSDLAAFPGFVANGVVVKATSQLWGFETNTVCNIYSGPRLRWDGLVGVRYLDLYERLDIAQSSNVLPG